MIGKLKRHAKQRLPAPALVAARSLTRLYKRIFDPRRLAEDRGERTVFHGLRAQGFLEDLAGKRILEVGPKHGLDSVLLAGLQPEELVLIDLPSKSAGSEDWLPRIPGNVNYISANILYMSRDEIARLGRFDLIWCAGVIYHNCEQLRLLRLLCRLTAPHGRLLLESSIVPNPALRNRNVVEIHWPEGFNGVPTVTHHPTSGAIRCWLDMVGFSDVQERDVYSRSWRRRRVVISAVRRPESKPHVYYGQAEGEHYVVGEAT